MSPLHIALNSIFASLLIGGALVSIVVYLDNEPGGKILTNGKEVRNYAFLALVLGTLGLILEVQT